ncbi:hypothetical protein LCGC14_2999780, partial [marine sediment metagenome]
RTLKGSANTMQTLELQVEQDHVESLTKVRNPIIAIEELIWNGLDADATKIDVKLVMNNLGGLSKIRVSDNGTGIKRGECEHAFGSLGGSAKMEMHSTPDGRVPHGKSGKGRFRAFGIGPTVTWVSRYKADGVVKQFDIEGRRSVLKRFEIGDEKEIKGKRTGVEVTIDNIVTNYPSLLDAGKAAEELSKRLALYLRKYPVVEITYDGMKVDPSDLERHCQTYDVRLEDKDGAKVSGELTVIEWNSPTDRALYLCDEGGFALEECPPGILGREDLAPEETDDVKDLEGKQRIVDLMLHRQVPQLQPDEEPEDPNTEEMTLRDRLTLPTEIPEEILKPEIKLQYGIEEGSDFGHPFGMEGGIPGGVV